MAIRPIYELYDRNKTYMTPSGTMATPQWVTEQYPAAGHFAFVLETDASHTVMYSMDALAKMKGIYNIDNSLTDAQAVEAIADKIYSMKVEQEEQANVPSVQERTAAALEFIALSNLPDEQQ